MAKSDHFRAKKLSPADELRHMLTSLEERQPLVKQMDSSQVLTLLHDLDQTYTFFLRLAEVNLLPEQSRFGTVQGYFRQKASILLKRVGGAATLNKARPTPAPPPEQWWWYIDQMVAQKRQHVLRQIALSLLIVGLLGGGIILAFNTIFAPAPEVLAIVNAENQAYDAIERGDYPVAIAAVEEGLRQVPDDMGLLVIKGVLYELEDDQAEADRIFTQAQTKLDTLLNFYLSRAQLYLRINKPEQAEADLRTALEIDETSSVAWLLLGQALEFQDRILEAASAYERAGDLAMASGENEVVVMSRLALGRMGATP